MTIPVADNSQFEPDPQAYDEMIDWDSRLGREWRFFQPLFREHDVRSVLDAACGTGRHAEMFRSNGLSVNGADVSTAMISYCRERWGESGSLRWAVRPYTRPNEPDFDAVICVGNSLAIADSHDELFKAIGALLASVRAGGVFVAQLLNIWRFKENAMIWQKCKRARGCGRDRVLMKGLRRVGNEAFIERVALDLSAGDVRPAYRTARLLGVTESELFDAARCAGATDVRVYGSYEREAYSTAHSQDLILVAERAR